MLQRSAAMLPWSIMEWLICEWSIWEWSWCEWSIATGWSGLCRCWIDWESGRAARGDGEDGVDVRNWSRLCTRACDGKGVVRLRGSRRGHSRRNLLKRAQDGDD